MRTMVYRGVQVQVTVPGPLFFLAVFQRDDDALPVVVCRKTVMGCWNWIKECYKTHGNGTAYIADILMPDPTYFSETRIPFPSTGEYRTPVRESPA